MGYQIFTLRHYEPTHSLLYDLYARLHQQKRYKRADGSRRPERERKPPEESRRKKAAADTGARGKTQPIKKGR